jgi:hypothetical protein
VGKRFRHFVIAPSFRTHNFEWQRNGVGALKNLYGHGRFPIPGPNLGVGHATKIGSPGEIMRRNNKLVETSLRYNGIIKFLM